MVRKTEAFYVKAKQYQDKRAELVSEYEKKLQSLKKYEGSKGYQKDLEKLQKDHKEALTALQGEYRQSLNTLLTGMDEAISRRKVNAPTNDQLNLIHLLKMKKKVTAEELDRVAEMVKDNGIAMGIISEIAHDNEIRGRNYLAMCKEMSSQTASEVVSGIRNGLEDWLQYDTTRAGRLANQYYHDKYGTPEATLRKRPLFEDMDGCFKDLAGLDHAGLQLFSEAVDGE